VFWSVFSFLKLYHNIHVKHQTFSLIEMRARQRKKGGGKARGKSAGKKARGEKARGKKARGKKRGEKRAGKKRGEKSVGKKSAGNLEEKAGLNFHQIMHNEISPLIIECLNCIRRGENSTSQTGLKQGYKNR
jgi:hypothetical protein